MDGGDMLVSVVVRDVRHPGRSIERLRLHGVGMGVLGARRLHPDFYTAHVLFAFRFHCIE